MITECHHFDHLLLYMSQRSRIPDICWSGVVQHLPKYLTAPIEKRYDVVNRCVQISHIFPIEQIPSDVEVLW